MPKYPTCPFCGEEMKPTHYYGYYEDFLCWRCDCDDIPGAEKEYGQFV